MNRANGGICNYCGSSFSKAAMRRHIDKCNGVGESRRQGEEKYFLIQVQGYNQKEYWMYLNASADATLKDLDKFLRDIWLECCGHLSLFRIEGEIYESASEPYGSAIRFGNRSRSMKVKLRDLFYEGLEFIHEYDFGFTTTLKLKIVSFRDAKKQKGKVMLAARNVPPAYNCVKCGEPATQLCSFCINEEYSFFCDCCAEEHDCGEDMMLPVVNSPRMGVCSYLGEECEYIGASQSSGIRTAGYSVSCNVPGE